MTNSLFHTTGAESHGGELFPGSPAGSPGTVGSVRERFPEIVGTSPAMETLLESVCKVAGTDSAVLILGESGTGKELIASAIHRLSSRSSHRYIPINCSAIPEDLLESELFGHEKGSFTGAVAAKQGLFEAAAGGTILLDEIGDMPFRLQAKLLRVLQEKQFCRVGSSRLIQADVRIIAATNVDIEAAIEQGRFRKDLYYRLNVLPLEVPALRERRPDIPLLLEHFLNLANNRFMQQPYGQQRGRAWLSQEARQILCAWSWPGNVRELQNMVERLVVLAEGGIIQPDSLPGKLREAGIPQQPETPPPGVARVPAGPPSVAARAAATIPGSGAESRTPRGLELLPDQGIHLPSYIEELENQLILQALERTGNNKNQAARLLGLNRTTLVERIKKRKLVPLNSPSREL